MRFDRNDKVVKAPDGLSNPLYRLTKKVVKAMKMKESLVGTKEEVLAKAAKMNAKNRHFSLPTDNKAHYTDHLIQGQYHCLEINIEKKRRKNAVLFVFGGGMILGSDSGDVGLSGKIGEITDSDVWFPYYPMCHEYDMLENVKMIFECYEKMLRYYKPENIVFLGFSSGAALLLDVITYINELNDFVENRSDIDFSAFSNDEIIASWTMTYESFIPMFRLLYDNRITFVLLIDKAAGTRYENFNHEFVTKLSYAYEKFYDEAKKRGLAKANVTREEFHVLISSYWTCVCEPFIHKMSWKKIEEHCRVMCRFFNWRDVILLKGEDDV